MSVTLSLSSVCEPESNITPFFCYCLRAMGSSLHLNLKEADILVPEIINGCYL